MKTMVAATATLAAIVAAGCTSRQTTHTGAIGTSATAASSLGQHTITILAHNMEHTLIGCNNVTGACTPDRVSFTDLAEYTPGVHVGSIIEFRAPSGWNDQPGVPLLLVSRVIATGGKSVKGDGSGHVQISTHGLAGPWTTLNEPYTFIDFTDSHAVFGPVTVPVGRVWVMGDHRNDSADSRFHCGLGGSEAPPGSMCNPMSSTLPVGDILAVATRIVAPPSRVRPL